TRSLLLRRHARRGARMAAAALALACTAAAAAAQSPRDRLLVTPARLAAHLSDANLVVLHVGDPMDGGAAYRREHVPGARLVSMRDVSIPSTPSGGVLEMLPADQLRERLQALGT